jgi:hypothetical protein
VHRYVPPQLPFDPEVTSKSAEVCAYGYEPYVALPVLPASAYTLAMIGEDALVPPTGAQPSRPCASPSAIRKSQKALVPQLL